jgi:hypothetical protein
LESGRDAKLETGGLAIFISSGFQKGQTIFVENIAPIRPYEFSKKISSYGGDFRAYKIIQKVGAYFVFIEKVGSYYTSSFNWIEMDAIFIREI